MKNFKAENLKREVERFHSLLKALAEAHRKGANGDPESRYAAGYAAGVESILEYFEKDLGFAKARTESGEERE